MTDRYEFKTFPTGKIGVFQGYGTWHSTQIALITPTNYKPLNEKWRTKGKQFYTPSKEKFSKLIEYRWVSAPNSMSGTYISQKIRSVKRFESQEAAREYLLAKLVAEKMTR